MCADAGCDCASGHTDSHSDCRPVAPIGGKGRSSPSSLPLFLLLLFAYLHTCERIHVFCVLSLRRSRCV
jgi:hypothetical protein